jgi:ParB family chromosome partitioning protein
MNEMNRPAIVREAVDLKALARCLNDREHRSREDTLKHAGEQGGDLIRAKAALPHGQWLKWLRENVEISQPQVSRYMQFSKLIAANNLTPLEAWQEWQRIQGHEAVEGDEEEVDEPNAENPPERPHDYYVLADWQELPADRCVGLLSGDGETRESKAQGTEPIPAGVLASSKVPHVSRNSGQVEWFTPPEYIEAAKAVMGAIDLDPASCSTAQQFVGAERYYTVEDDGLARPWFGRVWLNPPYASGLIEGFTSKLVAEYQAGRVQESLVLVNNATETRWFQAALEVASAVCFPTGRVRFLDASGKPVRTPLQGQAVLYVGRRPGRFVEAFGHFGPAAPWPGTLATPAAGTLSGVPGSGLSAL